VYTNVLNYSVAIAYAGTHRPVNVIAVLVGAIFALPCGNNIPILVARTGKILRPIKMEKQTASIRTPSIDLKDLDTWADP